MIGLAYLSQILFNQGNLLQNDLFEQLNTFLFGLALIVLIGTIQFLPNFPKPLETRWLLYQVILSAFSYLVFNSLFINLHLQENGSFVVKESSLGVAIVDDVFGNGFGIYAIVLAIFTFIYKKINGSDKNEEPAEAPVFEEKLKVKLGNRTYFVSTSEVYFIKSSSNYSDIYTQNGKHVIRESLIKLEEVLNPELFMRIHRSIIIKVDEVSEFLSSGNGDYKIKMKNGELLNVGNKYKKTVLERFDV